MKPYAEYKPTGLNWLPEVPAHWEVKHIGELFNERREKVSDKDFAPLSVTRGGVVPQMESVAKSDDGDNRKLVRKGDFVINSRSDRKSSSGVSALDGSVSLVNIVITPRAKLAGDYAHHLLKSSAFAEEFYRNGHGIVADLWTTRYSEMKAISLPVPPPDEQAKIVAYLDAKMAKIDWLIKLKEREIELLQEVVVKKATDCQNDQARKLRIKRLFSLIREPIIRDPNTMYSPVGVLNRGRGIFHKDCVLGKDLGDSEFFKVTSGDLLISGQFAWEGSFALLQPTEEGCVASHRYYSLRSHSDEICNEYLWAFFQTQKGNLIANLCSHGAAGRNKPLNIGELMNVYIPIPTKAQQDDIRRCCARLRILRSFKHNFVRLLQEYRTRLISDAVTGRIDLREVS